MLALHELQEAVHRSLVAGDDTDAGACIRADGVAAVARLWIHRNTFMGTLINALRLSYPAVHRLVGAEFFEAAVMKFIEGEPPRSAYLDEYGAAFPEFLARFPSASSVTYLPDVARLEWAVHRALHASDSKFLDAGALLEVAEDSHDAVRFVPHASVGLVRANYPVDTIWRAVLARDDAALGAIDLADAPVWLLVQRLATGVDARRLSEAAWRCTSALCAGKPIMDAIPRDSAEDLSALLADHLAAGTFIEFGFAESPPAAERAGT